MLVKQSLQAQLLAIFTNNKNTPEQAAAQMAAAIDAYIKTATVSVTVGGVAGGGTLS